MARGRGHGHGLKSGQSWSRYWNTRLKAGEPVFTDEMDATTGWAAVNGSMSLNSTQKISGNSIKVSSIGTTGSVRLQKAMSPVLTTGDLDSMRVWMYLHTELTTVTNVIIYVICNDLTWNHYYGVQYEVEGFTKDKWVLLGGRTKVVNAGTPDPNNVKMIAFNISRPAGVTDLVEISFDQLTFGNKSTPAVVFRFDDQHPTDYTLAYPYLKSKHMVGNSYINSAFIGGSNMSLANLHELYNNKWDICNHSANHITGTSSYEDILADFIAGETWLTENGFTRATKHVAWPGSYYAGNVPAAGAAFGILTGGAGGGGGSYRPVLYDGLYYPHDIGCYFPNYNEPVASVKAHIDKCILYDMPIFLGFHLLVMENPAQYNYLYSGFCEIVDYLESFGVKSLSISEFYRIASGPITVHHL